MPELTLTLIRGLPGSGKSTLAKQHCARHLETDMFFVDGDGVYCFQPELIKQAHQWCQSQCELLLKKKLSVVVSNTFVQRWEMEHYRHLAKKYGAKLIIKTCTGKYSSIHNVPKSTIQKMKKSWQE